MPIIMNNHKFEKFLKYRPFAGKVINEASDARNVLSKRLFVLFLLFAVTQQWSFAQGRYEYDMGVVTGNDGLKYNTTCASEKKKDDLHGIKVNGKQIIESKYPVINYKYGYFFAFPDYVKAYDKNGGYYDKIGRYNRCAYSYFGADVYNKDGQLIFKRDEAIHDCEYHKEIDAVFFQKTGGDWVDKTGRFVYHGCYNHKDCKIDFDHYYGDRYYVRKGPGGYCLGSVYENINNNNKTKRIDLYAPDKHLVGSINVSGIETASLVSYKPLGILLVCKYPWDYYNKRDDEWYDINLQKIRYESKYYSNGHFETFYKNEGGREHSYVFDICNKDTVYMLHFNDKAIKSAQGYDGVDLVLVQMTDGKVYDKQGNYLYTSNAKLPEKKDLVVMGNGNFFVRTKDGSKVGISTLDGTEILAPEFEDVAILADGLYAFQMNGYWGVIRRTGSNNKIIIPISRSYTKIEYSRTLKQFTFEKEGYKGTCIANGVQTSITKVVQQTIVSNSKLASLSGVYEMTYDDTKGEVRFEFHDGYVLMILRDRTLRYDLYEEKNGVVVFADKSPAERIIAVKNGEIRQYSFSRYKKNGWLDNDNYHLRFRKIK